eukprot:CAMPEP_0171461664 /NCGR_PEP_ID=MMETSP0945-20130129/6019_1 /TAXON_ID=109269 /ORGANISM="Vaucheria litorea, Strain CCMP2940" /LENGTH=319 /DNA_ID=CAMNT_0011988051 /DNA_START=165 /DNA_END=1124 /DNA_ORIENTATION=+
MPFGTSPAASLAGDFDGRVRTNLKKWMSQRTLEAESSENDLPAEVEPAEEPFEVFVGGLRELGDSIDENELRKHFEKFGEVQKLELTRDRRRHDQRGFCFVTYAKKASALACLEFKDHAIRGMSIAVERAIREANSNKNSNKKRGRRSRRPGKFQPISMGEGAPVPFNSEQPKSNMPSTRAPISSLNTHNLSAQNNQSSFYRIDLFRQLNLSCTGPGPSCSDPGYFYSVTQPSTPVNPSHHRVTSWNIPNNNPTVGGDHRMNDNIRNQPQNRVNASPRTWAVGKESVIQQLYSGWRNSYSRNHDQSLDDMNNARRQQQL